MSNCDYFIDYSETKEKSLSCVGNFLKAHKKKNIGHVEIGEPALLYPINGLYLFYETDNSDNLLYVGKATSKCFVDRLPEHFDPRPMLGSTSYQKR